MIYSLSSQEISGSALRGENKKVESVNFVLDFLKKGRNA
jgi:hypothetical protein